MNLSSELKTKLKPELYSRIETISNTAGSLNLKAFIVGGIVRDLILSSDRKIIQQDCDVTVTGGEISQLASVLSEKWKAKLISYPQFLTHTIRFKDGSHIDLITARNESYKTSAALPDVIEGDLKSDLFRRDFTVNAMALSLNREDRGEVVDLFDGLNDLKKRTIRILHSKSFTDDPTRIFRAARFSGRFGFGLENETGNLLKQSVQNGDIEKLSKDRIRTEIEKIFQEEKTGSIIENLFEWSVLEHVNPRLRWSQSVRKRIDFFDHSKNKKFFSYESIMVIKLSLWLMNRQISDAESVLKKLNFPKSVTDAVLFNLNLCRSFKKQRLIISLDRIKIYDTAILFFDSLVKMAEYKNLKKYWKDYQKWVEVKPGLDGEALRKMGYKPGPIFKTILEELTVRKFEKKLKNRKEEIRFVVDNYRRD